MVMQKLTNPGIANDQQPIPPLNSSAEEAEMQILLHVLMKESCVFTLTQM